MMRRLHSAERGAVAVVAGLFLVVLISAAAMAFDTGRLTWTKRSLQGMADDASLDAVRAVGDRRVPGSEEANALLFAQRSLERNHFDPAASGIHRIANEGGAVAISLHVYGVAREAISTRVNRIYPTA